MNLSDRIQHADVIRRVGDVADGLGIETYAVGGIVRDSLLDRSTWEVDFVSVGPGAGIKLAEAVAASEGGGISHVYEKFGTAGVRIGSTDDEIVLEFVGARKESYRSDSRKPIVEDGTLAEDLRRRDFTVNAMAMRVDGPEFGECIDPFDGIGDLKAALLRTPLDPDKTFDDDPLRMVRAARFASQLRFDVDKKALDSMARHADRIGIVSMERTIEEVRKILCSHAPSRGFKILFHSGLLHHILPELALLAGVETVDGYGHKDNFFHTLQVVENLIVGRQVPLNDPEEWLRWTALLHDIGKFKTKWFSPGTGWSFNGHEDFGSRMIKKLFRRLRLPLDERMEYVEKLIMLHHRPVSLVDDIVTDSAVRRLLFEAGDDVDDLMRFVRADITSKNPSRVRRYLGNFDLVEQKMVDVEEADQLRNFQPPLDGHEIMAVVGVGEGVAVGIIKENVREAILDGQIKNDHEAAYALMMEIKDDAVRRATLFQEFIRSLKPREKKIIGTIKELIFFGDVPTDADAAREFLRAAREQLLAGAASEPESD